MPIQIINLLNYIMDLSEWLEDKYKRDIQNSPELATILGLKYHYDELDDISEIKELEIYRQSLASYEELLKFDKTEIDENMLIHYNTYRHKLVDRIDYEKYRHMTYAINHIDGIHINFIDFMKNYHIISNENDAYSYIKRLIAFDQKIDQTIKKLEKSKHINNVPPMFTLQHIIKFCDDLLNKDVSQNPFILDFITKIERFDNSNNFYQCIEKVILNSVNPSYLKLKNYLIGLLNFSKHETKISEDYYNYLIKHHTTLKKINPKDAFDYGLSELNRIHREINDKIMANLNMSNVISIINFFTQIKSDNRFVPHNENTVFRLTENYINKFNKKIPSIFNAKPTMDIILINNKFDEDELSPKSDYISCSVNKIRNGKMLIDPHTKIYDIEATSYKINYGYHYFIGTTRENKNIPKFYYYTFNDALLNGWPLYVQKMALEYDCYDDNYSNLGRLNNELLYVCAMIIDIGIHCQSWTFEYSLNFIRKNMIISYDDAKKEVEKCIMKPAEILSYKIGMDYIFKLRKKMSKHFDKYFNIKQFHDIVIKDGCLPLSILNKKILNHINCSKSIFLPLN